MSLVKHGALEAAWIEPANVFRQSPDMNFDRTMSRLPDEGVVRIAFSSEKDGYVPEAIDAAKAEVERRGLTQSEIFQTLVDVQEEREVGDPQLQEPLGNVAWLVFATFAPLLITFVVAIAFGILGYRRKCGQAFLAIWAGFIGWGIITIVLLTIMVFSG